MPIHTCTLSILEELQRYLAVQFNDTSPAHLNLLSDSHLLSNPVFTLLDYNRYTSSLPRHSIDTEQLQRQQQTLPPRFIIGFSYKPDINTILRLFSVTLTQPPSQHSQPTSTLLLSSALTLVYSNSFLIPWSNITHTDTNNLLLFVDNGELSYCLNGEYIPHIWNTNLWLHNISNANLHLNFSHHLREVSDRVRWITL